MSEFQLRDVFNEEVVEYISHRIASGYPEFQSKAFVDDIMKHLHDLSFGERSSLITDTLEKYLPTDYEKAIQILIDCLGPEIPVDDLTGYDGFYIMPLGSFVARHGLPYFDLSMTALYEMTKRFSSEGPIRTFLRKDSGRVFGYLDRWVNDENTHVRRLVSEGTRPRLPLSSPLREFIDSPQKLEKYLVKLKDDPVLYVRRSVANNFNDISKDNPDYLCRLFSRFSQKTKEQRWVIKHSLRTLLKKTYPPALKLIGYSVPHQISNPKLEILKSEIEIGADLNFEFEFISEKSQKLLIHYVIHYLKVNEKLRPKVFILRDGNIEQGITLITSKQSFRQMSTRNHYPGPHLFEIRINGVKIIERGFSVI